MMDERGPQIEHENNFDIENFFNYENPRFEEYRRLQQQLQRRGDFGYYQTEFADYWDGLLTGRQQRLFLYSKGWKPKSDAEARQIEPGLQEITGAMSAVKAEETKQKLHKIMEDEERIKNYLSQKLQKQILIDLGCGGAVLEYRCPIVTLAQRLNVDQYIGIDAITDVQHVVPVTGANRLPYFDKGYFIENDMLLALAKCPSNSANITINGVDSTIIRDPAYNEALATEMIRVCGPEGVIFGVNSSVFTILSKKARGDKAKIKKMQLYTDLEGEPAIFFEKIREQ